MVTTAEPIQRRLEKLAIAVPLTEDHMSQLRSRFPSINIVRLPEDDNSELVTADAVVTWNLSPEQLRIANNLRWLHTAGAGVENVLSPELLERRILITNNSGVHGPNMAEHLLAMMLAFARQLPPLIRNQVRHEWENREMRTRVFELSGQTLLLIGLGDIAQALAIRASALGMRIIGVRRRLDQSIPAHVSQVYGTDALPQLIGEADHVAITLPLTRRTRNLLNGPLLDLMKPTAYIYNVGRGATIESAALVRALVEGRIAGAGLDVTDPEPLPVDSPLWDMENVIITAHTSGATPHYWDRALPLISENIARYLAGTSLVNEVDQAEGY